MGSRTEDLKRRFPVEQEEAVNLFTDDEAIEPVLNYVELVTEGWAGVM